MQAAAASTPAKIVGQEHFKNSALLEMGLWCSFFCMSLKGMNIGQHGTTDILAYFSQNRTEQKSTTHKVIF